MPRYEKDYIWDDYSGFSAFGLIGRPVDTIRAVYAQAQASGWNTARVCTETEFWPDDRWHPRFPRDIKAVERLLETTGRIPGAQVLLMQCTLKGAIPEMEQIDWNWEVSKVASKYRHVALEVVNEAWHPVWKTSRPALRQMIYDAKSFGLRWVGADDHTCVEPGEHWLDDVVTFRSWHPCRDVNGHPWDPRDAWLRKIVQLSGGLAVLSETVSYAQDPEDFGMLVTTDKERIQSYADRCNRVQGCKFTFHSLSGLAGDYPYDWFPRAK